MGSSWTDPTPFSVLPKWRTPWSEFVLSYGIQAIVIGIAIWIPVLHPEIMEGPKKDYHAIELVPTPVPVNHEPQRQLPPKRVLVANLEPEPINALRLTAPQPRPKPKMEDAPAPEVKIAEKKLEALPPSKAPVIPKVIQTNVFSTGSSAPQTTDRPAEKVQTGGFGDPNGVKPNPNAPPSRLSIAAGGSGFDLPEGPGQGNGTGGAKGKVGTIASAGFGNGVAVQGGGGRGGNAGQGVARVQGTAFGNAMPAPEAVPHKKTFEEIAATTPVSITSKPSPQYTEEARRLKVEGEVLVKVVFTATGEVRVLNVIRGLGHGLDESAVKAAQNVRFNPALRNGQPVDSTATLHIVFQLS